MNITRPTLLLDEDKMNANLDRMIDKAKRTNTELIPHFKTHQSKEIGEICRSKGVQRITVSSVKMAEYFAANGWSNITVAFPFNPLEVNSINTLIKNGVEITLLVTELSTLDILSDQIEGEVNLMIEIDAGYGRSGVPSDSIEIIQALAQKIKESNKLNLYGLYCHPGNTYSTNSVEDIQALWADAIPKMKAIKDHLDKDVKVRMGDTPGCTVVEDMEGVDEIGPGNFIFYDLVMNYLDVCDESDIAVAVACPVVAKNESENKLILHGGAVHFSKDHLYNANEQKFFGEMVVLEEHGWSSIIPNAKLISVSQEHGILKVDEETFEQIEVGDVIGILPIHSCLTANLLKEYRTFDHRTYEHLEKVW